MELDSRDELITVVREWDRAMVENDADAIGRYMAEDWVIIGPDGRIGDRAAFLGLVRSGVLSHDVMESHELQIRLYGSAAVVLARGISGGQYQGQPFREVERVVRPGGLFAAWTYHAGTCDPPFDDLIHHFYWQVARPHFADAVGLVDRLYEDVDFPGEPIDAPTFRVTTVRPYISAVAAICLSSGFSACGTRSLPHICAISSSNGRIASA